jgi:hypothetical protein
MYSQKKSTYHRTPPVYAVKFSILQNNETLQHWLAGLAPRRGYTKHARAAGLEQLDAISERHMEGTPTAEIQVQLLRLGSLLGLRAQGHFTGPEMTDQQVELAAKSA